ncbi:hypothetical protein [Bradyrhizobium amphicarpaeae]|nr:hypothetical protein [Bradyrhizobium amphicarpaeae]
MAATKVCFFVTPIGHPNSEPRRRADRIQKYILNQVMAGKYKVLRADELPNPGSISHQIIKWLYDADLVVADLTGANPNVVYELAIRHSFNKTSIHLINQAETIPFDLKDERTIIFNIEDLDSIDGCKKELIKNIREINRKGFKYSSPVFRVLGVEAATAQEREEFLETMVDKLESIASDVSSIETDVSMIDLSDVEKGMSQLSKELYDIKLDVQKLVDRAK